MGGEIVIDKSLRTATAERFGDLIVVRMTGGEDCLWLNMYLDKTTGQMVCDSDIGSYAYHWGRHTSKSQNWTDFCCQWLSNSEWLLRKCCGEKHTEKAFSAGDSAAALREMNKEANGEECDMDDLDDAIDVAYAYDNARSWSAALCVAADERNVELPEEWWCCMREDYTTWQMRFAEICREVIVPAIRAMEPGEAHNDG